MNFQGIDTEIFELISSCFLCYRDTKIKKFARAKRSRGGERREQEESKKRKKNLHFPSNVRSEGNDVASKLESSLWAGILFESESLLHFLFLGDSFEEEDIAVV